jgi:uncharacterized protein
MNIILFNYALFGISLWAITFLTQNRVKLFFSFLLFCSFILFLNNYILFPLGLFFSFSFLLLSYSASFLYPRYKKIFFLSSSFLSFFSLLMMNHKIPGFHNFLLFQDLQVSPDSKPFNLYLNVDKPIGAVGAYLLYSSFLKPLNWHNKTPSFYFSKKPFSFTLSILSLMIILFMPIAHFSGFATFSPKIHNAFIVWALNNFFLVAFSEELIFRGILLNLLPLNKVYSLLISSLFFGLLHFKGGLIYVALSSLASLFYGYLFLAIEGEWRKKLIASISLHCLFNIIHFLFFTYPSNI